MVDDHSRAARFLDSFHRVESLLAARLGSETQRLTFYELVRRSKDLTDQQKNRLRDIGDLRNAIVHAPGGWRQNPIADPREDIVSWLETQVELIERPPLVLTTLKLQPPRVLDSDSDLIVFLDQVRDQDFSQSPVRMPDGGLGLITTNAVTRWIASGYDEGVGVALAQAEIADVLTFVEAEDQLVVKPRNLRVVEAVRLFAGAQRGSIPAAIVLTEDGKPEHKPIGICARADVAELLQALGV